MKWLSALLLFVSYFSFGQKDQPNIVLFMVDDMGWQDTSVPFWTEKTPLNERYRTPNMERLAAQGVKFTNAYATPVCTPTRVSLITGMNAARHKVTNWTSPYNGTESGKVDDIFNFVPWNKSGVSPIPDIENTVYAKPLPAILKENGYYTIHVGKAHFGAMGIPAADPKNLGFVMNIGGNATGHPASYFGEENYGNIYGKAGIHAVPDLEAYYGSDIFLSQALTIEALKALDYPREEKKPFFLYLSHYAVHSPLHADRRFVSNYDKLDEKEAAFASMVEGMDKSLGDLMDYLESHNLSENTIVIFMSDNGSLSRTPPRGGEMHTHNLPLKVGKGSVHEGGIREPMIVKWPNVLKGNTVNEHHIIIEDFFPSILELAGIKSYKTNQVIDGESFVSILKKPKKAKSERSLVWHYPHHWGPEGPGINFASAIRKGDWKLLYDMKLQKLSLYNLADDIGEHNDLAIQNPKKVKELAKELTAMLKERGAQMPTYKSTGQAVLWADELVD
ncbi:Arylsulfatase A [Spirosomataceae bacterium TFI 002]|nr:Arylsulfatase A [Spirosomataceae bacterium TFI 002]